MQHHRRSLVVALGLLLATLAIPAHAQLTTLDHVWTVPGAMNLGGGIGTFIPCTNGGTITETIGVEVYGPTGTFINAVSTSVAPNATVLFATTTANGFSVDVDLATGVFTKGSARVKASTTKGILCSAFLADVVSALPTSIGSLTIDKKFKQKGD